MQPYLYQNRGGRTERDRVNVSGHPCRVELLNGDRGGGEAGGEIGRGVMQSWREEKWQDNESEM